MKNFSLKDQPAFSSFSVDDIQKAKEFYGRTLGLPITEEEGMGLKIEFPGFHAFAYPKENHQPAGFTILNFIVEDIDDAVDGLTERGVVFEHYDGFGQDEKGISRGTQEHSGPVGIAWFTDPAGNILSVIQE